MNNVINHFVRFEVTFEDAQKFELIQQIFNSKYLRLSRRFVLDSYNRKYDKQHIVFK